MYDYELNMALGMIENDIGINNAGDLLIENNDIATVSGLDLLVQRILMIIYDIDLGDISGVADLEYIEEITKDRLYNALSGKDIIEPYEINVTADKADNQPETPVEITFEIASDENQEPLKLTTLVVKDGGVTTNLLVPWVDTNIRKKTSIETITEFVNIKENTKKLKLAYEPASDIMIYNEDEGVEKKSSTVELELPLKQVYYIKDHIDVSLDFIVESGFKVYLDDIEIDYTTYINEAGDTSPQEILAEAESVLVFREDNKSFAIPESYVGKTLKIELDYYEPQRVFYITDGEFERTGKSIIYPASGLHYMYSAVSSQELEKGRYKVVYNRYVFGE